jgi:hypothetical protein
MIIARNSGVTVRASKGSWGDARSEGMAMAVVAGATDDVEARSEAATPVSGGPARHRWQVVAAVAVVALAASPIVIAALSLIGDTWYPAGDWASMLYRISQVGTRETPLVGTYTVKGWAHPGPLLFWLAAPLYHLTGGDSRSMEWTAAVVNVVAVVALGGVAWRRGRWPLLVGVMLLVALLVHGFGPERVVDLWNPYLPLIPFLLTVFLVWDAALGRRRALVEAVFPACLVAQCHLAFVVLVGLLAVWLLAWIRWWPRLIAPPSASTRAAAATADGGGDVADRPPASPGATHRLVEVETSIVAGSPTTELPGPPWSRWYSVAKTIALIAVVLWLAPLFDLLFDLHNPLNILDKMGVSKTVGPIDAVGLVGRYVRPDGPWIGGPEPVAFLSVQGSGPLPLLAVLGVLAGCLVLARRRGLTDVVALATLSLFLVIGSVLAASEIVLPAYPYLTQWLKITGGLVWFTVGWTGWRLLEPAVRTVPVRRYAAAALACAAIASSAGWTWHRASTMQPPVPREGAMLQRLRVGLDGQLPHGERLRVEIKGDAFGQFRGVVYWLIKDGYDVTTSDGDRGLKWGHAHRWNKGEHVDEVLTLAVSYEGALHDAYHECQTAPGARLLASVDSLRPQDRAWLDDFKLRRLGGPGAVSDAEIGRADRMVDKGTVRLGLFEAPRVCAKHED